MAIERNDLEERQARLDKMVTEFRASQQRRQERHGMVLWNGVELAPRQGAAQVDLPPTKLN